MTAIEMRGVCKSYDGRVVLDQLDLEIQPGEVFALLGPNGAGKTTAVEMMEGYRRPDAGSVRVLGHNPMTASAALRAKLGIVLQHTTAFENTTVEETVAMFAAMYPRPLDVAEALALVGLSDRAGHVAETLSGGQRRRLEIACGLVGRPEVLFLDEPSTGLDPEARREIWRIVQRLRTDGATVLLTTHYLDEAEALADRIGVLLSGRLAEVDTPERLGGRRDAMATVAFERPTSMLELPAGWTSDGDLVVGHSSRPDADVTWFTQQHGTLRGLTVTRPTLEDVYLAMVARWDATAATPVQQEASR